MTALAQPAFPLVRTDTT